MEEQFQKTKKKHIAIIGSRGYPVVYSGFETLVKELAEGLVKEGFRVTVYCHDHFFEDKPKIVNGINLVYLTTSKRKNFAQLVHSFKAIFHCCFKRYDLIFSVNSANGIFGLVSRLFFIPSVINVDGMEWQRPKWNFFGKFFFYLSSWFSTIFYNRIITDANAMADIYEKKFYCKSTVIEYGANINESSNSNLISDFNLEPNSYYIIVGRLIPDNNADIIVNGFLKSNSTRKLVIVGDVPYKDRYADKIKSIEDKRLKFVGYIRDRKLLDQLVKHSYAYFHGHEYGGTNPTLLEALSNNAKILALNTVFTREVLDNDKYGLFFEKNSSSISKLVNEIEESPSILNKFIDKGVIRIKERYNWKRIITLYSNVFKEVIK